MSTHPRGPRLQDFLLGILFLTMAFLTTNQDPSEIALILLIGTLQVTESRFVPLDTPRGKLFWNLLKLVAGYLLIGYTGGVQSTYYLVLLFPVISAAGTLGAISTLAFAGLACGAYLSFLLYVDWSIFHIDAPEIEVLMRRVLFLGISGLLVNTLAVALRQQSLEYRKLAEELAESNRHLREAEAQVRRTERLAALGQLTAGLAHELRNPLGTIKGSADMLELNLPPGDEIARELAGYISSEVDRTNSLVSRFLDFARPLQLRVAPANLCATVGQAVATARREAEKRDVHLVQDYSDPIPDFPMDAELMERLVLNLVLNAIQASPPGSQVQVQARRVEQTALVRVIDHGSGIEPAKKEAIFNPFFTTKSDGTGLGLAIVAKIVDEHRGKIQVESNPGEGATFTVTLPMTEMA